MEENYMLHKFLEGKANSAEIEKLKSSPEYASYIKLAEASSGLEAPLFNATANFEVIQSKKTRNEKVIKLNPFRTLLKVAAMVAVICVGYLYLNSLDATVSTQIAEKTNFTLPDSSEVILNSNSEITYNKKDWDTDRSLSLIGEAYFKVSKGENFNVHTDQGIVSVLGTQFNVFSRDHIFYVHCYEGLVSVKYNDTLIKLPAGTKLKVKKGVLVDYANDTKVAPNWIMDESHFENALIIEVLNELQSQYPIIINSENVDMTKRFTGSFTHKNLDLALKAICDPLQLKFTIDGSEVLIYGTGIQ